MAELVFREGDYRQAYSLLLQAVKAKPDYLPPHKGLAQMYRLSGKFAEAKEQTDYVLDHSPDDIDALLSLGTIQTQQKKLTEAEGTFNRILEIQPGHVTALLALASVMKDRKDPSGTERYLKLALERNPRSIPVYLSLLKFYIGAGRFAEAEPLFTRALATSNNNIEILEAQLGYYEGRGQFAEAESVARKIQSSRGDDPKYRAALADYYVQINQWSKAASELERLLQKHKDDPATLHELIEVRLNLNDRKTAETLNENLLKKNPKDAIAHLVKGRLYLADGDVGKAMLQFNEAQKYQPNLPALHYWYAQAHLRRNELDQATNALRTALRYDANFQTARLNLAELEEEAGAADAALSDLKRLLLINPGDLRAILLYGRVLISKKDYPEARKVLNLIGENASGSPEMHRQLAVLAMVDKNLPTARREFIAAWNLQPDSRPLLEEVLKDYVAEKHTDEAFKFLHEQVEQRPTDPLLYHELAQVFLLQNKRSEASEALKKALELAPAVPDTSVLLADLYAKERQPTLTVQTLKTALAKNSRDENLFLRAGMIFEEIQAWDNAREAYQRVLDLDADNAVAKNNIAWLLAAHGGNIDLALTLAQQAKEKLSDNLQVTNTIGWVYYQKGIYQTAWNYLNECAQKDPKSATFQYELGMTSWKLGKREEAKAALRTALRLNPNLQEAQLAREVLAQL